MSSRSARAVLGEDTWGPHRANSMRAETRRGHRPGTRRGGTGQKITARDPGLQSEVVTFLGDRLSESLTGETADIAVKCSGDSSILLDATASAFFGFGPAPCGHRGHRRPAIQAAKRHADSRLQIRPEALVRNGLKMQDVMDAVQSDMAGAMSGPDLCRHPVLSDVELLLPRPRANRHELLSSLMIASPSGTRAAVAGARVAPTETRFKINHDGGSDTSRSL